MFVFLKLENFKRVVFLSFFENFFQPTFRQALTFKEGVTQSRLSGNPLSMSYRWNQLCELSSMVVFIMKSARVGFRTFFSDGQVVPCTNDQKYRKVGWRGGHKKRIFLAQMCVFGALSSKPVRSNPKIWGVPAIGDCVTPSLNLLLRKEHIQF